MTSSIKEGELLRKASEMKFFDRIRITQNENKQLSGTIQKCQTVTDSIFRLFQNIIEFFQGGSQKLSRQSFEYLWIQIDEKMTELETSFDSQNTEQLQLLKTLLKLQGAIIGTRWEKTLKDLSSYKEFQTRLDQLQEKAKTSVDLDLSDEKTRWIHSNKDQRIFRVSTASGQLPYIYGQIPKGAVLVTNLDAYKARLYSENKFLTLNQKFRQFQKYLNFLFTGSKCIHAEISLGDGSFFHQKTYNGSTIGHIEKRKKDRVCSHDVRIVPQKDMEWEAVDRTIAQMDQKENRFKELRTSFASMLRTVFYKKRNSDYQLPEKFDSNQRYACSAVVAIFLGMAGVDIGEPIGKRAEDISPADLVRSDQLQDLYTSGL